MSKVFGIGLAKTGTTTLYRALKMLGYSAVHNPNSLEELAGHDAATNILVADNFEELDGRYPGSRFIYTVRERDAWLRSSGKHSKGKWLTRSKRAKPAAKVLAKRRVYGTERFEPDMRAAVYDRHERRIRSYFQDRPEDLLVIDLCASGDHWPALCEFLGKPVPAAPFPHENRTANVLVARWRDLVKPARKATRRAVRETRALLGRLSH